MVTAPAMRNGRRQPFRAADLDRTLADDIRSTNDQLADLARSDKVKLAATLMTWLGRKVSECARCEGMLAASKGYIHPRTSL